MLYQLSYFRMRRDNALLNPGDKSNIFFCFCKRF